MTLKFHPNAKQLYSSITPFGGNIFISEWTLLSGYTKFTNGVFDRFFLNDFLGVKNDSAATAIKAFLIANNAKIILHTPLELMYRKDPVSGIVTYDPAYLDFLRWQLETYAGFIVSVQLALETVQVTKPPAAGMTTDDYINMIMLGIPIIQSFGLPFSLDDGLMSKDDAFTHTRNTKLSALTNIPIILARQYWQGNDQMKLVAGDTPGNLIKVNTYWNTIIPSYQIKFRGDSTTTPPITGYFPNAKQVILQTEIEDSVGAIISGKPLGNLWLGLEREYMAKNTKNIAGAWWMKTANLFPHGVPAPEYASIKRLAACQNYAYTMPVDIDLPDCSAVGFSDGQNSYAVLINNQSSVEHSFALTDIKIHHKSILGNIITDSGSAVTWDSPQINQVETLQTLPVHSNSVTVAKFTTI